MSKGYSYLYEGTTGHIIDVANSLPDTPSGMLSNGWEDISHPQQRAAGHWELRERETGLRIRYDQGSPGADGFRGKNHYHIYNPDAAGNSNLYLDSEGNPVPKSSSRSHILPKGDK